MAGFVKFVYGTKKIIDRIILAIQENSFTRKNFWRAVSLLMRKPYVVFIEATNACNAKCLMCPRDKMTRAVKRMDFSLFKKIVDECAEMGIAKISPFMYGEPLLNKDIVEMVKYIKEKTRALVNLNTNAQLLDSKVAEELLDAGLDVLTVSIDGATKESYEKIRKGLKFEKVVGNIEEFIKLRDKGRYDTKVNLFFVRMKDNEDEERNFLKKWKGKVNRICVSDYSVYTGEVDDRRVGNQRKVAGKFPCPKLWTDLTILSDGRVALCCQDFDGRGIIGDAKKQSLRDIWDGKVVKNIRKCQLAGHFRGICKDCNFWDFANFNHLIASFVPFSKKLLKGL